MATPTTLLLIRHADVHNPDDVLYGRLPHFGLSAEGRDEAARTAAHLCGEPLAVLYSSPQLRARQTARAIAARHPGLPIHVTRLLAEIRTGWQGVPNAEMADREFNFYDPPRQAGDESLVDIERRLRRWVHLMLSRYTGRTVVGVSHGDPVMVARLVFTGVRPTLQTLRDPHLYPTKGSITRLAFQGSGPDAVDGPVQVTYEDPNRAARRALGVREGDAAGGHAADAPWAARSHAVKDRR